MKPISLLEKLQTIIQMVQSSSFLPILFLLVVGLGIFFFFSKQILKDHFKKIYFCCYGFLLALVCIRYPSAVGHVFDYMIDQLMMLVYFPSFMVILMAFGFGSFLFLKTMFSGQSNFSKLLSIVPYSLQLFLMVMTMKVAMDNQVDLFATTAVYQNQVVLTLFQLMIGTVGVWLFLLGFRKVYLGCVQLMERRMASRSVVSAIEETSMEPLTIVNDEEQATVVLGKSFLNEVQPVLNEVRPIFKQEKKPVVEAKVQKKHVKNFAQDIYQIMVENEDHLTIKDYQELRSLLVSMK